MGKGKNSICKFCAGDRAYTSVSVVKDTVKKGGLLQSNNTNIKYKEGEINYENV